MHPTESRETERAMLGLAIRDPSHIERLGLTGGLFTNEGHRLLFAEIRAAAGRGEKLDPVSLHRTAVSWERPELLGPSDFAEMIRLGDYIENVNPEAHVEEMRKMALWRDQQQFARQISCELTDPEGSPSAYLAQKSDELNALSRKYLAPCNPSAATGVAEAIKAIQAAREKGGGLSTGLENLDEKMNSGMFAEQIILAARTSIGKSALAMWVAASCALRNRRVLVFSVEMYRSSIFTRLLSSVAGVPMRALINPRFLSDGRDMPRIIHASERLAASDLVIHDGPQTIEKIAQVARAHHSEKPVDLMVIDYLQKVRTEKDYQDSRSRIDHIAATSYDLTHELGVPTLALAQLNRGADDRKPRLNDLKESSDLENNADCVLLLDGVRGENERTLAIAKARNGEVGAEIDLDFDGRMMQWRTA